MKVYVIEMVYYEDTSILGIYRTLEGAQAAYDELPLQSQTDSDIVDYELGD